MKVMKIMFLFLIGNIESIVAHRNQYPLWLCQLNAQELKYCDRLFYATVRYLKKPRILNKPSQLTMLGMLNAIKVLSAIHPVECDSYWYNTLITELDYTIFAKSKRKNNEYVTMLKEQIKEIRVDSLIDL